MPSNTTNLALYKKDPTTDGVDTFNITTMLNDNWDKLDALPGTATPVIDGVATVGVSKKFAREDHKHPTDTSLAPVASPTFTGTVTLPADPTTALQAATKQYVDQANKITAKSTNATLTTAEQGIVEVTTGTSVITITLPSAATPGLRYTIKKVDAGTGTVTIATTSSQTIDGVTSKTLNARYVSLTLVSNGTSWDIIVDGVLNPWSDNTLASRSVVRANQNVEQTSVPANVWTKVLYQNESYDQLNEYDTSLSRYTASKACIVHVEAGILTSNSIDQGQYVLAVYKNGALDTFLVRWGGSGTNSVLLRGGADIKLAVGEYVEIYMNFSAITSTLVDATYDVLTITRVA